MKIGFDGKRAVNNTTGLGNYSRLVIEQLAASFPADKFLVYAPDLNDSSRLVNLKAFNNVEFFSPYKHGISGALWRTYGIKHDLVRDCLSLYHGLSNELPLNIQSAGIPSVVTVHDVIYRRLPGCYSAVDRRLYDFKYGRSCRNATRIIAISERTAADIVEFYGVSPEKIDVVYQGCDESFKHILPPHVMDATVRRLKLPRKYILQVGTVETRKNLALTVRALSALPPDISLLAVGRDRKGYRASVERVAREAGVADRVIFRDDIAFCDFPAIYQSAAVIVYPSRYEGFGIPVIEGLESRRPVVAATGSCLEEAGGEAAMYVNPDNPRQLAETLNGILGNPGLARSMIAKGILHCRKFDTSLMAQSIMEVYRKAIFRGALPTGRREGGAISTALL